MRGNPILMPLDDLLSRGAFLSLSAAAKGVLFVLHGLADDEGRLAVEPEALRMQGGLMDLSPGGVAGLLGELRLAGLLVAYGDRLAFLPGWPACMTTKKFVARSHLPLPPADLLDAAPDYRRWLASISTRCRPGQATGERSPDQKREPRHRCLWPNEWPREHKKWREQYVSAANQQEGEDSGGSGRIGEDAGGFGRGSTATAGIKASGDSSYGGNAERARRGAATAKRSDATAPEQAMPRPGNLALPPRASEAPGHTKAHPRPGITEGDTQTVTNAEPRTPAGIPAPAAGAPQARGRATVDQGGAELHLDGRQIAELRSMRPGFGKPGWHHGVESTMPADVGDRIEAARQKIIFAGFSPAEVQEKIGFGQGKVRCKHADAIGAAAEILAMRAAEDAALRAGARPVKT
jgi:hypothetical protein